MNAQAVRKIEGVGACSAAESACGGQAVRPASRFSDLHAETNALAALMPAKRAGCMDRLNTCEPGCFTDENEEHSTHYVRNGSMG